MDPEKLNKRSWGRGRKKRERGREPNRKRLLKTENKLRVDWGVEGEVGEREEGEGDGY